MNVASEGGLGSGRVCTYQIKLPLLHLILILSFLKSLSGDQVKLLHLTFVFHLMLDARTLLCYYLRRKHDSQSSTPLHWVTRSDAHPFARSVFLTLTSTSIDEYSNRSTQTFALAPRQRSDAYGLSQHTVKSTILLGNSKRRTRSGVHIHEYLIVSYKSTLQTKTTPPSIITQQHTMDDTTQPTANDLPVELWICIFEQLRHDEAYVRRELVREYRRALDNGATEA